MLNRCPQNDLSKEDRHIIYFRTSYCVILKVCNMKYKSFIVFMHFYFDQEQFVVKEKDISRFVK